MADPLVDPAAVARTRSLGPARRRLYRTEEGRWLDEVVWESRAAAEASEDTISQMAQCARCIGLMDHETFQIDYAELEQTTGALVGS